MSRGLYSEHDQAANPGTAQIVLLHGWGSNLRVFDPLRSALASQYALTAIDLPGHGRSPWWPTQAAQRQFDSIAQSIPPDATILGWSLGGQLALQLSQLPALRVRALVLIGTTPRFVRSEDWPFGVTHATLSHFASELARNPTQCVADFLQLQVRGSAAAEAVLETLQRSLLQHGAAVPAALAAGLGLLEQNDLRALAARVAVPSLVIAGQYDRVTPPQAAEALAQMLAQSQWLLLKRAGHAAFLSHTTQVVDAIQAFLSAHGRGVSDACRSNAAPPAP